MQIAGLQQPVLFVRCGPQHVSAAMAGCACGCWHVSVVGNRMQCMSAYIVLKPCLQQQLARFFAGLARVLLVFLLSSSSCLQLFREPVARHICP